MELGSEVPRMGAYALMRAQESLGQIDPVLCMGDFKVQMGPGHYQGVQEVWVHCRVGYPNRFFQFDRLSGITIKVLVTVQRVEGEEHARFSLWGLEFVLPPLGMSEGHKHLESKFSEWGRNHPVTLPTAA